jgi:hypothetical protein
MKYQTSRMKLVRGHVLKIRKRMVWSKEVHISQIKAFAERWEAVVRTFLKLCLERVCLQTEERMKDIAVVFFFSRRRHWSVCGFNWINDLPIVNFSLSSFSRLLYDGFNIFFVRINKLLFISCLLLFFFRQKIFHKDFFFIEFVFE